jgi:Fe-S oxidoreductase
MREEVLSSPLIWYCLVCYRCTARCPQGVDFADVMRALRFMALKGHHAPPNVVETVAGIDRDLQASRAERIRSAFEEELAAFVRERAEATPEEDTGKDESARPASEETDAEGAESSASEGQEAET